MNQGKWKRRELHNLEMFELPWNTNEIKKKVNIDRFWVEDKTLHSKKKYSKKSKRLFRRLLLRWEEGFVWIRLRIETKKLRLIRDSRKPKRMEDNLFGKSVSMIVNDFYGLTSTSLLLYWLLLQHTLTSAKFSFYDLYKDESRK